MSECPNKKASRRWLVWLAVIAGAFALCLTLWPSLRLNRFLNDIERLDRSREAVRIRYPYCVNPHHIMSEGAAKLEFPPPWFDTVLYWTNGRFNVTSAGEQCFFHDMKTGAVILADVTRVRQEGAEIFAQGKDGYLHIDLKSGDYLKYVELQSAPTALQTAFAQLIADEGGQNLLNLPGSESPAASEK